MLHPGTRAKTVLIYDGDFKGSLITPHALKGAITAFHELWLSSSKTRLLTAGVNAIVYHNKL